MSAPRVLTVIGTRPEAIKMAPLILALEAEPLLEHQLAITAQHRELLDEVLELFKLEPDYDLNLMREQQTLGFITAHALARLEETYTEARPDFVLVHGDTTTTFVAALAAFYAKIPVGHVEAGLRTSTVSRPFPEELSRRIVDQIATHYYCPTAGAAANLGGEYQGETYITGNTALDAVEHCYSPAFKFSDPIHRQFTNHDGPRLLLTAHRRESWGEPLEDICQGVSRVLDSTPGALALVAWHPNPVVREQVESLLGNHRQVLLTGPPRYDVFINLLARAHLILTDSGGIQEEVTQLRRFALVLREETERPEAVSTGFARLVGTDPERVAAEAAAVLPRCVSGELPPQIASPFGDGQASERILAAIKARFNLGNSLPNYIG